jgi:2-keto-4-pentenoate hydratase
VSNPGDAAERLRQVALELEAARKGGDHCPAWLPGALSLDEALAVQLELLERRLAAGEKLAGWKVGLTSPRARKALGADVRPFGYLLASRVFASGASIAAAGIRSLSIEPELCFAVGRRLAGSDVGREQVMAAIDRVSAGFELNERRAGSARPDLPAMVTDCLTQWGIACGSGVPLRDAGDLGAVRCVLSRDGEQVYEGLSRDELDCHVESLRRLVGTLAAHGRALEPGDKVITGAFARFDAAPGQRWRASYEGIGSVEVTFT